MYYLKEQVYFEPLFNSWYAWPYLIAPVQGARHMVHTHRRIMKSFINNYQLHMLAADDPNMVGSEILHGTEKDVLAISELVKYIDGPLINMVKLSKAISDLDEKLRGHTSGESLEYLYKILPTPLQGYVELFFDMEHNPSYRLIEGLLYESEYYNTALQSASFGLVSSAEDRSFVFSTPRLAGENQCHIEVDFISPVLQKILASRDIPLSKEDLAEIKESCTISGGLPFENLFTTKPATIKNQSLQSDIRLNYTGHAGFLLETADISILFDPVIASRPEKGGEDVFSFSQLPEKIDYICLTHSHQDHTNIETLLQLKHKVNTVLVPKNNGGTLADPSLKLMLKKLGFCVLELEDMENIPIPDGRIVSLPFIGEHGDLNIRSKCAWYVDVLGKKLFFGADSSNIDPNMYRHMHKNLGDIDVLAIGMECVGAPYTWMYGALHSSKVSKNIKESRRLNGCDSQLGMGLVNIFNPKQVFIYALGMEPSFKYFMGVEYDDDSQQMVESQKMIELCNAENIPCEKLVGKREFEIIK